MRVEQDNPLMRLCPGRQSFGGFNPAVTPPSLSESPCILNVCHFLFPAEPSVQPSTLMELSDALHAHALNRRWRTMQHYSGKSIAKRPSCWALPGLAPVPSLNPSLAPPLNQPLNPNPYYHHQLSVMLNLSLSLSLALALALARSLTHTHTLSLSLSLSLTLTLSLSLPPSHSFTHSLPLSLPLPLFPSIPETSNTQMPKKQEGKDVSDKEMAAVMAGMKRRRD